MICKRKFQKDETVAQVTTKEEEAHLFGATYFSTKKSYFWMIGSGCTNQMTYDRNLFKEFVFMENKKDRIGNDDYISVIPRTSKYLSRSKIWKFWKFLSTVINGKWPTKRAL